MASTIEKPAVEYFHSKEVKIGGVPLGSNNPIRVQSMTTSNTMDTKTTVEQCISLINAGCDYVRLTVPSINEANNLINIKKQLSGGGYKTPLIADIHYTPKAAEIAARIVEKVRINPGNYLNSKSKKKEYTNCDHEREQAVIIEHIKPLIDTCKQYGTALRIGVNHGSLSDRILNTYGNTPTGMVNSAMEFINACEYYNYNNIVISMKSSDVNIMIQAYKLLVNTMIDNGINYPLHLGLTEAGNGQDGRIKSASSIGYLLSEGIGDTIRVSLTESPEKEVLPAKTLANLYSKEKIKSQIIELNNNYNKPETSIKEKHNIQAYEYPIVISSVKENTKQAADYYYNQQLNSLIDSNNNYYPLQCIDKIDKKDASQYAKPGFTNTQAVQIKKQIVYIIDIPLPLTLGQEQEIQNYIYNLRAPVILKINLQKFTSEEFIISASVAASRFLTKNFGAGIWLHSNNNYDYTNSAFAILQALGKRKTKAEYIACPGCGRTLFNLESITQEIQKKTMHLKNLKIGIMGCIVNGPGEMAGSDYGYVGAGKDKIHLYRGEEIAEKNIPSSQAVDKLINLIKQDGKWLNS